MDTAYFGPRYTSSEIKTFLDSRNIQFTAFKSSVELSQCIGKLIFENNIVGWFQGRIEFGPRALGNRSILANPCNSEMRDRLNQLKRRELFRPFAPIVHKEHIHTYFECDYPLQIPTDFMLMVYLVRTEWRLKLPAITHVDGSARVQTLERSQNSFLFDLIYEFGKLSGIPMLFTTSFNIKDEPIVCDPEDALRSMHQLKLDYLVMENFLVERSHT